MSVYILYKYPITLPDRSKPCIMTADNEQELHEMATTINVKIDKFNTESDAKFYIISRTQMKKAINNGALTGAEARIMIRFKKAFPIMKQHEAQTNE